MSLLLANQSIGGDTNIIVTDASLASDTALVEVSFTIFDIGSGIDSILLTLSFLIDDIGYGTDLVLPDKEFWILESGLGTEIISTPSKEMFVLDSGYAVDDLITTVLISILEDALGTDSTILGVTLLIDDSGLSADVVIVTGNGVVKKRLRMRMGVGL